MEKIVIAGYGGHSKSVIDSIELGGKYQIVGYTDIEDKKADDVEYLGTDEVLSSLFLSGVDNIVIGIGFMGRSFFRDILYSKAKEIGYQFPIIVDPSAIISRKAILREGTFVGKRAVINAGAEIGKMCIINTGAIIEHECVVGDYSHVAVGAVLCGNVKVGEHCLIGANSTLRQGISIGSDTIIGAGAVTISDQKSNQVVVGIPAKTLGDKDG